MHGKASDIKLEKSAIFESLPPIISAGRYHSLVVSCDALPEELKVTAKTGSGEIMALEHKAFPVFGVQFHPESILTPDGRKILRNFLTLTRKAG